MIKTIPADKVEFDIVLENGGTVTANYQFAINCVGGYELMRAFDVKIENKDTGTVVFDEAEEKQVGRELRAYASAWEKNFKTSNTATYHVTLALTIDLNENEFNTNIDYIVKNGADVVIKNGTWDGTKLGVPETETFAVHGDVAGKQTKLILENVDLISGSYGIGIRNYTWVEKSGKILILRIENGCFQPFFLL